MSGIAGYFISSSSGKQKLSSSLASMLKEISHQGSCDDKITYEEDAVAIGGVVSNNVNNVDHWEDEEVVIMFQGLLTNMEPLEKLVSMSRLKNAISESRIIKEIYIRKGKQTPSFLKGRFCFVLWDKKKRELLLATDRYGYGYLYYYKNPSLIVFATEIKAILKLLDQSPRPCLNGICDIHNFHAVFNDDTPFENISLMPHGTIFLASQNCTTIERYWEYPNSVEIYQESEDDLLNHAKDILIAAVSNSIRKADNLGVMITGGLDSRLITGIAHATRPEKQMKLFHIFESRREQDIVKNISHNYRLPIEIIENENVENVFYSYLSDQIYLTDGQWAFFDFIPVIREIGKRNKGIVLLNGYLLDTMFKSGFAFFPKNLNKKYFLTTDDYADRFSFLGDYLADMIFTPEYAQTLKKRKRERIEEVNEGFANVPPTEASLRFYCIYRGRRHIYFSSRMFEHFVNMALPGIDYDLQDFAWRLPYHLRSSTSFYRRIICEMFPVLGDIEWGKTGKPLRYGEKGKRSFIEENKYLLKYAIQRATRGHIDLLHRRNTFDRKFRQNKKFRDQVCVILLDKRTLGRGFFDYNGAERLIRQQLSGRDYGGVFQSILSVEFLFRRFIEA